MQVAALQLQSNADVADNLARVKAGVRAAAEHGARLVVLPENFAYFGAETEKAALAEDVERGGPISDSLRSLARMQRVHLVAGGMPERSDDPRRPFNTALVIDPDGSVLARYRKLHLFDVELPDGTLMRESAATSAGDEVIVVNIDSLRVGLAICYDLRFPRLFEALVDRGAQLIALGAAFTEQTGRAHWHVLLRARAIETQTFVVAAAQCGSHPNDRKTYGHALVCDPWGNVVAECQAGQGFCSTNVDLAQVERVRALLPCARHRRELR